VYIRAVSTAYVTWCARRRRQASAGVRVQTDQGAGQAASATCRVLLDRAGTDTKQRARSRAAHGCGTAPLHQRKQGQAVRSRLTQKSTQSRCANGAAAASRSLMLPRPHNAGSVAVRRVSARCCRAVRAISQLSRFADQRVVVCVAVRNSRHMPAIHSARRAPAHHAPRTALARRRVSPTSS